MLVRKKIKDNIYKTSLLREKVEQFLPMINFITKEVGWSLPLRNEEIISFQFMFSVIFLDPVAPLLLLTCIRTSRYNNLEVRNGRE